MEIYQPEQDSYLLSKYVKEFVKPNSKVLDVGCGSGIQSETALKNNAIVTGIDINPNAIQHCKQSIYTKKGTYLKSNLFANITEKYDAIIFNPPYLPDEKDPKDIKDYTTGGKQGWEIIEKFMSQVNNHLNEEGIILLVFSSLTKKHKVDEAILKYLFEYEVLEEKNIFFEKLYCYKIIKSNILKKFNSINIKKAYFFAKGKRGNIYKAKFKGKDSAIKSANIKSKAQSTIILESKWLKKANELSIGPKLYYSDNEIAVMEFIEGRRILDFINSCKKNKRSNKIIKKILIDVLNQMHILDSKNIEKKEMCNPYKHIIIKDNKPVLIDFERMRYSKNPNNVTQFLQFIASPKVSLNVDKTKIMKMGKEYKQNHDLKPIKDYIKKEA